MNMTTAQTIDTGDHVRHEPSGETWVVAYVANELLCACGWPCTLVPINECTLTAKASREARRELLLQLADGQGDDPRRAHARRVLASSEWTTGSFDLVATARKIGLRSVVQGVDATEAQRPCPDKAAPLEREPNPDDELLVACITLDGTTLTIEASTLSDMFGTDNEQHAYELKFKRMKRSEYEALGEFNGF